MCVAEMSVMSPFRVKGDAQIEDQEEIGEFCTTPQYGMTSRMIVKIGPLRTRVHKTVSKTG